MNNLSSGMISCTSHVCEAHLLGRSRSQIPHQKDSSPVASKYFPECLIKYNSILCCFNFGSCYASGNFWDVLTRLKYAKILDMAWTDIRTSVMFVHWDLDPQCDQWHDKCASFWMYEISWKISWIGSSCSSTS